MAWQQAYIHVSSATLSISALLLAAAVDAAAVAGGSISEAALAPGGGQALLQSAARRWLMGQAETAAEAAVEHRQGAPRGSLLRRESLSDSLFHLVHGDSHKQPVEPVQIAFHPPKETSPLPKEDLSKICCSRNVVHCLACLANTTQKEYCAVHPYVDGCDKVIDLHTKVSLKAPNCAGVVCAVSAVCPDGTRAPTPPGACCADQRLCAKLADPCANAQCRLQPACRDGSQAPTPKGSCCPDASFCPELQDCKDILMSNPPESARVYSDAGVGSRRLNSMLDSDGNWPVDWTHKSTLSEQHPLQRPCMQIDLGKPARVAGVVVQGRGMVQGRDSSTAFEVQHSEDSKVWTAIPGAFNNGMAPSGKAGASKQIKFPQPVRARFLRLRVLSWTGTPSIRAGVLTCKGAAPTSPGCYTMLPSGCAQNFSAGIHTVWTAEDATYGLSAQACEARKHFFDKLCGVTDARVLFVAGKERPKKEIKEKPKDPEEAGCYWRAPTGCAIMEVASTNWMKSKYLGAESTKQNCEATGEVYKKRCERDDIEVFFVQAAPIIRFLVSTAVVTSHIDWDAFNKDEKAKLDFSESLAAASGGSFKADQVHNVYAYAFNGSAGVGSGMKPSSAAKDFKGRSMEALTEIAKPRDYMARNPVLIKMGFKCRSEDDNMGTKSTLEACAEAVEQAGGSFFVYGKGSKEEKCWKENTASASCNEGWESDEYYDFYELQEGSTLTEIAKQHPSWPRDYMAPAPPPALTFTDGTHLASGTQVVIKNVRGADYTWLHICGATKNVSGCHGGWEVHTTSGFSESFSDTWMIEKADGSVGSVRHGDAVYIKNMYRVPTYLDVCGTSACASGLSVATTDQGPNRDGESGTWVIERRSGSGIVAYGDKVHIKNKFNNQVTYLDACGKGGTTMCGGGYEVATSRTWDLTPSLSYTWMFEKAPTPVPTPMPTPPSKAPTSTPTPMPPTPTPTAAPPSFSPTTTPTARPLLVGEYVSIKSLRALPGVAATPAYLDTCAQSGCNGGWDVSATKTGRTRGLLSGAWKIVKVDRSTGPVRHGDEILIINMYDDKPTYLGVCSSMGCTGGLEVSTTDLSRTPTRDVRPFTWVIEKRKRGKDLEGTIGYGEDLYFMNTYFGVNTYLDTCGESTCGDGFEVSTTKMVDISSEVMPSLSSLIWSIEELVTPAPTGQPSFEPTGAPTEESTTNPVLTVLTVNGINYNKLVANASMASSFRGTVQQVVALGAGVDAGNVAVEISSGSVVAAATITPADSSTQIVMATLNNVSMESKLVMDVSALPGIDTCTTGAINVSIRPPSIVYPTPKPTSSGGLASCPCVVLDEGNVPGRISSGGVMVTIGEENVTYPAEALNGTCNAWDYGVYPKFCDAANPEPWCKKKFCFVDPCNCNLTKKLDSFFGASSKYKGNRIYYSYATCGEEDSRSSDEGSMMCAGGSSDTKIQFGLKLAMGSDAEHHAVQESKGILLSSVLRLQAAISSSRSPFFQNVTLRMHETLAEVDAADLMQLTQKFVYKAKGSICGNSLQNRVPLGKFKSPQDCAEAACQNNFCGSHFELQHSSSSSEGGWCGCGDFDEQAADLECAETQGKSKVRTRIFDIVCEGVEPTLAPTSSPTTSMPTSEPTTPVPTPRDATLAPTVEPTAEPTKEPTATPEPTSEPTPAPTPEPFHTPEPTQQLITINSAVVLSNVDFVTFNANPQATVTFATALAMALDIQVDAILNVVASGHVMSLLDQSAARSAIPNIDCYAAEGTDDYIGDVMTYNGGQPCEKWADWMTAYPDGKGGVIAGKAICRNPFKQTGGPKCRPQGGGDLVECDVAKCSSPPAPVAPTPASPPSGPPPPIAPPAPVTPSCTFEFVGFGYCFNSMETEIPRRVGQWVLGSLKDAKEACCKNTQCNAIHFDSAVPDYIMLDGSATSNGEKKRQCWKRMEGKGPVVEGDAVVKDITIKGIDYSKLQANQTLASSFVEAMKRAIAHEASVEANDVDVVLAKGSVVATCTIRAPSGANLGSLASALASSSTMNETILSEVLALPGISDATDDVISISSIANGKVYRGGEHVTESRVSFKIRALLPDGDRRGLVDQFKGQLDSGLSVLENSLLSSGLDVFQNVTVNLPATLATVDNETSIRNLTGGYKPAGNETIVVGNSSLATMEIDNAPSSAALSEEKSDVPAVKLLSDNEIGIASAPKQISENHALIHSIASNASISQEAGCFFTLVGEGYCFESVSAERPHRIGAWNEGTLEVAKKECCGNPHCNAVHWNSKAIREEKIDLSGGSSGTHGENTYTAMDGTVVTSSARTFKNKDKYYMSGLFDGSNSKDSHRCRTKNVHTCYWLTKSRGTQTLTITLPNDKYLTKVRVRPIAYGAAKTANRRSNYKIETKASDDGVFEDRTGGFIDTKNFAAGDYKDTPVQASAKVVKVTLTQERHYGVTLEELELYEGKEVADFVMVDSAVTAHRQSESGRQCWKKKIAPALIEVSHEAAVIEVETGMVFSGVDPAVFNYNSYARESFEEGIAASLGFSRDQVCCSRSSSFGIKEQDPTKLAMRLAERSILNDKDSRDLINFLKIMFGPGPRGENMRTRLAEQFRNRKDDDKNDDKNEKNTEEELFLSSMCADEELRAQLAAKLENISDKDSGSDSSNGSQKISTLASGISRDERPQSALVQRHIKGSMRDGLHKDPPSPFLAFLTAACETRQVLNTGDLPVGVLNRSTVPSSVVTLYEGMLRTNALLDLQDVTKHHDEHHQGPTVANGSNGTNPFERFLRDMTLKLPVENQTKISFKVTLPVKGTIKKKSFLRLSLKSLQELFRLAIEKGTISSELKASGFTKFFENEALNVKVTQSLIRDAMKMLPMKKNETNEAAQEKQESNDATDEEEDSVTDMVEMLLNRSIAQSHRVRELERTVTLLNQSTGQDNNVKEFVAQAQRVKELEQILNQSTGQDQANKMKELERRIQALQNERDSAAEEAGDEPAVVATFRIRPLAVDKLVADSVLAQGVATPLIYKIKTAIQNAIADVSGGSTSDIIVDVVPKEDAPFEEYDEEADEKKAVNNSVEANNSLSRKQTPVIQTNPCPSGKVDPVFCVCGTNTALLNGCEITTCNVNCKVPGKATEIANASKTDKELGKSTETGNVGTGNASTTVDEQPKEVDERNLPNSSSQTADNISSAPENGSFIQVLQVPRSAANESLYFRCVIKVPRRKGLLADQFRSFMRKKVNQLQGTTLSQLGQVPGIETVSLGKLVVRVIRLHIVNARFHDVTQPKPQLHNWTYTDTEAWKLNDEWSCNGTRQSPINIVTSEVPSSASKSSMASRLNYKPLTGRELKNTGQTLEVEGEFGDLELPDGKYKVKEFHFHFPSEHKVDGKKFAGEMQITHQREGATGNDALAVIAILLTDDDNSDVEDHGPELAFFSKLGFGNDALPQNNASVDIRRSVDLSTFGRQFQGPFYYYDGSQTVPPCSETVHWIVMETPALVNKAMMNLFKREFGVTKGRPVQALRAGNKVLYSDVSEPEKKNTSNATDLATTGLEMRIHELEYMVGILAGKVADNSNAVSKVTLQAKTSMTSTPGPSPKNDTSEPENETGPSPKKPPQPKRERMPYIELNATVDGLIYAGLTAVPSTMVDFKREVTLAILLLLKRYVDGEGCTVELRVTPGEASNAVIVFAKINPPTGEASGPLRKLLHFMLVSGAMAKAIEGGVMQVPNIRMITTSADKSVMVRDLLGLDFYHGNGSTYWTHSNSSSSSMVVKSITTDVVFANMDYDQISAHPSLAAAFRVTLAESVALELGILNDDTSYVDITLYPGSVIATVVVYPPTGADTSILQSKLENTTILDQICQPIVTLSGISSATSGDISWSLKSRPQVTEGLHPRYRPDEPDRRSPINDAVVPAWAHKQQRLAGIYKLPSQPECAVYVGSDAGVSDYGKDAHQCMACAAGCTRANMQPRTHSSWSFLPPLEVVPAFDMMMMVEFMSIQQIAPFALNGVWHQMSVEISRGRSSPWFIEMGPQVRGGVAPGDALQGKHIAMISDTKLPSPDGTLVKGRWLAMPSKRGPGDIGECKRACVGCDDYPQLAASGLSTGTLCSMDVAVDNAQSFVYRIHQTKESQSVQYDGATYKGAEWQINIHDTSTGGFYVLARFVLEGTSKQNGITSFSATHRHLGCSPCDAYYQAARVTGPFVLQPKEVHEVSTCDTEVQKEMGQGCGLHRTVSLGGLSILYESGPGVWPARHSNRNRLFSCKVDPVRRRRGGGGEPCFPEGGENSSSEIDTRPSAP